MTDGWIQHDGGECPVKEDVDVTVFARNGREMYTNTAAGVDWTKISYYRLHVSQDDAHAAVALLARLLEAGGANGNASVRDWIKAEDETRALLNKIRGAG